MRAYSSSIVLAMLPLLLLVSSAPAAAETIPDVVTLKDLRAAPLHRLPDGAEVRLGLSDGGDAAGPWRMLYCFVEKPGDPSVQSTRPTTQAPQRGEPIGPLTYTLEWRNSTRLIAVAQVQRSVRKGPPPTLFAEPVRLSRKGVAVLRVFIDGGQPLAERELNVKEVRPALWTDFARPRARAEAPAAAGRFVVRDDAMPSMLRLNHAGFVVSTTHPASDSSLPADIVDRDREKPGLRVTLEGNAFVIRADHRFSDYAPEQMLARWWVNGNLVVPRPVRRVQRAQQMQRQIRQVDHVAVDFGLPDFLPELKPGDRVALQIVWSPGGHELITDMDQMQQLMQLQTLGSALLAQSNRLEFELTAELLEKRDNPEPPPPRKVIAP